MPKQWVLVLGLVVLLLFPAFAEADCAALSKYTDWVRESDHVVTFYMREVPIARLTIPYCDVLPSSTIRLRKSYVCDSDTIEVDDEACSIITVQVLY